jgi:hypothetical protein
MGKKLVLPTQRVAFNVPITEISAELTLSYTDTVTPKTEVIMDDAVNAFTTNWKAPADAGVDLVFGGLTKNLSNSWVRNGAEFSKAGLTITSIQRLDMQVFFKQPQSIQAVRIVNPFPYPIEVVIRNFATDKTTVVGSTMMAVCPPRDILDLDTSQLTVQGQALDAVYMCVGYSLFVSTLANNTIVINDDEDGFFLPLAAVTRDGVPMGPSVTIDAYNLIDEYGLGVAAVAGMFTGVELAYAALSNSSPLKSMAMSAGVGVGSLAGIIVLGIYEGWLDMDDVTRLVLPALGTALAPMAGQALLSGLAGKYTGLAGNVVSMGIGGAAIAGEAASAWVLITMIDNITIYIDA